MAHPWYGQVMQLRSCTVDTQPWSSGAPRCGHAAFITVGCPLSSRTTMKRLPNMVTPCGCSPTSLDSAAAYQKFCEQ
jgi:hypothetical protein